MTDSICSNWIRSPYFMFVPIWFSFPVASNFEYDHAVAAVVTMFWMARNDNPRSPRSSPGQTATTRLSEPAA